MAKIIGYEIVTGVYEGNKFENVYLTLEKNFSQEKKEQGLVGGTCATVQKVKGSVVRDFEVNLKVNGHGGLLGKNVRFLFDGFKNVALIKLIE